MSSYEKYMKLAQELDLCAEALEAEGDVKSAALVDEACHDLIERAGQVKARGTSARNTPSRRRTSASRTKPSPRNARPATRRTARKVYTARQIKVMKEAHAELYDIARALFRSKDLREAKNVLKLAEELEEEMMVVPEVPMDEELEGGDDQVCLDEELAEELSEALGLQGFDEYSPEEPEEPLDEQPEALASARARRVAAARRARLVKARKAAEARRASTKPATPAPRSARPSRPTPKAAASTASSSDAAALRRARARRLARLRA